MWAALWIVILCIVHIQFKYCNKILIASVKIIETTIIVAAIQLYLNYDPSFYKDIIQTVQSFPNFDNS